MSVSLPTFDPGDVAADTAALLGPQVAAWQVSLLMYGMLVILHSNYVHSPSYSSHSSGIKVTIWAVFVLVTIYNCMVFSNTFRWMVSVPRQPLDLVIGWPLDFLLPVASGLIAAIVQTFLAIRASVLIRHRKLQLLFLGAIGICILASLAGATLTTALGYMYWNNTYAQISIDYNNTIAWYLWAGAVVDCSISVVLFLTLNERRSGDVRCDSIICRLSLTAIQTATYTAVLALTGAIVSLIFKVDTPGLSLLSFAFWVPLPGCYSLSLYTTLSTRRSLQNHLVGAGPTEIMADELAPRTLTRERRCDQGRLSHVVSFRLGISELSHEIRADKSRASQGAGGHDV
ncbi:hypothetical protein JCM11491_004513 [Sporobolomyces phaffii]